MRVELTSNTPAESAPRPWHCCPLYPLTPILFCATSIYLLQASLSYTGIGALVGVAVLLAGLPVLFVARRLERTKVHQLQNRAR